MTDPIPLPDRAIITLNRRDFLARTAAMGGLAAGLAASASMGSSVPPVELPGELSPAPTFSPEALALTCASINAAAVCRRPLRLFVGGYEGEQSPKCRTRPLTDADRDIETVRAWREKRAWVGAEVTDHPLLDAIRARTSDPDYPDLIHTAVLSLDLRGQAFWWPELDSRGVVRSFWTLPEHAVSPVFASEAMVPDAFDFGGIRYAHHELIRFRMLSIKDPYSSNPCVWKPTGDVRLDRERIANIFDVPVAMLPDAQAGYSRTQLEAVIEQHERAAVDPRCHLIASTLTRWTHSHGKRIAASNGGSASGFDRLFWAFDKAPAGGNVA